MTYIIKIFAYVCLLFYFNLAIEGIRHISIYKQHPLDFRQLLLIHSNSDKTFGKNLKT